MMVSEFIKINNNNRKVYLPKDCLALDRLTQETHGISAMTLMGRAGKSCANEILKALSNISIKREILIFSGPGNNGGDGLVIARELFLKKNPVKVVHIYSKEKGLSEASAFHLRELQKEKIPYAHFESPIQLNEIQEVCSENPGLIIDALFGVGACMPFSEAWQNIFKLIMERAEQVISIDHPSGVPSSDGLESKDPQIKASVTLSIGLPKLAHYTHAGPAACGKVLMCDAGFPQEAIDTISEFAQVIDEVCIKHWMKPPDPHSHKNQLGHLGFFAGSAAMPGALHLCVQGALQSGVGKITVFGFEKDFKIFQRQLPPEVMYSALDDPNENLGELIKGKRVGSMVIGPGLQMDSGIYLKYLKQILMCDNPLVLDAEVFRLLTKAQYEKELPNNSKIAWVGHTGEQQRFFSMSSAEEHFEHAFENYEAWLKKYPRHIWLRKGLGSMVVSQKTRWLNSTGNAGLAKGGSGDLLAGIIGALSLRMNLEQALVSAVWIHGRCADILFEKSKSTTGITPSTCALEIPGIMASLYSNSGSCSATTKSPS
jgi:ADP-dependent NAD(P)H-hydrate dehydratase / NAD(P)H-hydrate epimerase